MRQNCSHLECLILTFDAFTGYKIKSHKRWIHTKTKLIIKDLNNKNGSGKQREEVQGIKNYIFNVKGWIVMAGAPVSNPL